MNNGGLSLSGCLKCRMKGTFIGKFKIMKLICCVEQGEITVEGL